MENHFVLASDFTNRGYVVDDADLIIHMHQRHQNSVFTNGFGNRFRRDDAILAWIQISDLKTFALELTTAVENSLMLDLGSNNVLAFLAIEVCRPFDSKVVSFSGTGGPDDFTRITIEQVSDILTRCLNSFLSLPAKHVRTRSRVTKVGLQRQTLGHFLRDAWVYGGSG